MDEAGFTRYIKALARFTHASARIYRTIRDVDQTYP